MPYIYPCTLPLGVDAPLGFSRVHRIGQGLNEAKTNNCRKSGIAPRHQEGLPPMPGLAVLCRNDGTGFLMSVIYLVCMNYHIPVIASALKLIGALMMVGGVARIPT